MKQRITNLVAKLIIKLSSNMHKKLAKTIDSSKISTVESGFSW